MRLVIDIPEQIYEDIQAEPKDMKDSFIKSIIQMRDMSAITVFRAIQNGALQMQEINCPYYPCAVWDEMEYTRR
jgi:hypothetical protein